MMLSKEYAKTLLVTLSVIALVGCTDANAGKGDKKAAGSDEASAIEYVIDVTDSATLEKHINGSKPVIVKFSASWCGPCRAIKPMYEDQAGKMKDAVTFVEVDIDAAGDLATKYGVRGVPTFVYFKDGKLIERNVGGNPAHISTATINKIFGLK